LPVQPHYRYRLITLAFLLLLPPLMAVVADGLNLNMLSVLWQPCSGRPCGPLCALRWLRVLCVILTMMLLWSSRELYARQARKAGQALELTGMLILAMPGIVLATGLFYCSTPPLGCRKGRWYCDFHQC
jgi:thiamine transport system permease protein